MLVLRRVFSDGDDRNELVLLHYRLFSSREAPGGSEIGRSTLVMTPCAERGKRQAAIFLPDPMPGSSHRLHYFFSAVRRGTEWFSPPYEVAVPSDEVRDDLGRIEEEGEGNLRAAPGRGNFRLLLPLREGESGSAAVRYGFGAMRKKPSAALCRASLPADGGPPVVEVPEALSVLKDRPMPFFLYHVGGTSGRLYADKINCARLTLRDDAGEIVCARLLWGDPAWTAQNLTVMEARRYPSAEGGAAQDFFAPDREAYLQARRRGLEGLPAPRTFEAFVFGPDGSAVEYCFQAIAARPDGSAFPAWRNREGGNFRVTL
jgi:hypothetical protein